jgi:predicted nucleic-acid-binding Zn-ribbon protein
MSEVQEDLEE